MIKASPAQHGMWLTERLGIAGAAYQMPLPVVFEGPLDKDAMLRACEAVISAHPILDSDFEEVGGSLYVVPGRRAHFRYALTELGPERYLLRFEAHHLVFDGPSKDILLRDLATAYSAALARAASSAGASSVGASSAGAFSGGAFSGGGASSAASSAGLLRPGESVADIRNENVADATYSLRTSTSTPPGGGGVTKRGKEEPADASCSLHTSARTLRGGEAGVACGGEAGAACGGEAGAAAAHVGSVPDDDRRAADEYWARAWQEPEEPILPGLSGHERTAQPGECLDFTLSDVDVEGFTRFEVVFAGLQALLMKYGNPNPTIAVNLGTRTAATRDAIGLFVNELPLRASGEDLAQARAQLREIYQNRAHPVTGLSPRLAMAPISLSYRRRAETPLFAGLRTTVEWTAFHGTARNALHVQMVDGGSVVEVKLHYDPRSITKSYVERVAADYTSVVRALVESPQTRLADLPYTGETSHIKGPQRVYTGSAKVHHLVAAQAAVTPRAVAVTGADQTLTYAELTSAAGAVAEELWQRGVAPGDRVAVRMRRTPELVAKLLGVWWAGAAYVPIDPEYPAARQALLLGDSQPAALITEDQIVRLEGGPATPSDLAYVIYTSGSTGRPKGVQVAHRSVVNLLHSMREEPGSGRWLATASYSFDMSIPELWLPLVSGGSVVLATEEQIRDAEKLLKLIRETAVTHVHVTPSTWQRLLEVGFEEPGVIAIAGAEALPASLAKQVHARSAELWNLYGPTETTVWSTAARLDGSAVALGGPIANTHLHVLDAELRPVPIGIPGELCIGGAGVTRGYLNRPDLTSERFVDTEWGRLYRTGDRVRLLANGEVEWIGRLDNQIKLRGYRIELGEIESRLLEHPGVRAAAVVANPELVAYVAGSAAGLREHLTQVLPAYMVPSCFVELQALPLTPNGKLDRAALPAYEPPSTADGFDYTGMAKEIFEVWAEVLGRDDIGPQDSLFDLGGHSLTVTKISSRLRKRGIVVPLHVFFDHPTISGVAAAAEQP